MGGRRGPVADYIAAIRGTILVKFQKRRGRAALVGGAVLLVAALTGRVAIGSGGPGAGSPSDEGAASRPSSHQAARDDGDSRNARSETGQPGATRSDTQHQAGGDPGEGSTTATTGVLAGGANAGTSAPAGSTRAGQQGDGETSTSTGPTRSTVPPASPTPAPAQPSRPQPVPPPEESGLLGNVLEVLGLP